MREFVVTLRCGLKFVVKADRVTMLDRQFLALVVNSTGGEEEQVSGETVALFERGQVVAVVAKDHLVSEEQAEPIPYRGGLDGGDDIPF